MSIEVGVVGLGIMGSAMSANLIAAHHRVYGYDVDANCNHALSARGGTALKSVAEVARSATIVITSLPDERALREVCQGKNGFISGARAGLTVIETSTLSLTDKQEARTILEAAGICMLDCPLSGTGAQAAIRDLSVYASGDAEKVQHCEPVFDAIARSMHYLGDFGNGTRMKLIANLLVAIHNVSAAEALVLGMKSGLDPAQVFEVIKDGAGTSRMFEVRGRMMVDKAYEPATMRIDMWQKDMRIINELADSLGCPTPLLSAAATIYDAAQAAGRGREDTASVCAILEELAGVVRGLPDR